MFKKEIIGLLMAMLVAPTPSRPQKAQKKLVYENHIYAPTIRTVRVGPMSADASGNPGPAVATLDQQNLVLTFDDLHESAASYYVRLVHCNFDWTPSTLRDLDFSITYNESLISNYTFSSSPYTAYVHYRFEVPEVKLPGNYLLMVYKDGNRSDLAVTWRIMIVEPRLRIVSASDGIGSLTLRSTNQQISFMLDYRGTTLLNPMQSVHVVVRQNHRWDNARQNVKPSFIREDVQQIEYRLFEDDKYFSGGNEFRFVDFRSLLYPGQNTDKADLTTAPPRLWVRPDKSRTSEAYAQYRDLNGGYFIDNRDAGSPEISAGYVATTFTLLAPALPDAATYVIGAFNLWKKDATSRMSYNDSAQAYEATVLLKQGWYDYQYHVESERFPPTYFEGSHYQTENVYEVLVYYSAFQPHADLLIGYATLPVNPR